MSLQNVAEFERRDRVMSAALSLLREQGYYRLQIEEVAMRANVPVDWLASEFPLGKEQLVCESMKAWAPGHIARLNALLMEAPDTASALEAMFDYGCKAMRASGNLNVCPIAIIALENALSTPMVRDTCAGGMELLSSLFRDRLRKDRIPDEKLADLSMLISTVFEGCFVSSRAYNNSNVMNVVGRQLADLLRSYVQELSLPPSFG